MSWTYIIHSGELKSPDEAFAGTGYSGKEGTFRNNPHMVSMHGLGPIPPGSYTIGPAYDEIPGTGPCTMALTPDHGTDTFGRSLFRIHGDNLDHDASHGCIIFGPSIRREIAMSEDRHLEVFP